MDQNNLFWNHIQVFSFEIINENLIKNGFKCFRFWNIVYQKNKVFCFTCKESSSGLGYNEDVFTKYGYSDWKNIKRSLIPTYGSKTT